MDRSDTYGISFRRSVKMEKKCIQTEIIIVILSLLLSACSKMEYEQKMQKEEQKKINIGITFDTFVLERWARDRDVFVSTAEKQGAVVDVQNANGDIEKQKKQIRQFIEERVDIIVVVAVDCYSLKEEVQEAKEKGIPVISYDRLIQGCETDLYITIDSTKVGELMAQAIMSKLPSGGKVVMLCGPEQDANSADIARGFESVVKDSNLTIEDKVSVTSWAPENGFEAANKILSNAQDIDAVMCGNDGLAGYVIKALSEKQLAGKVVVVGQDADLEACQRIVEGTQTMTAYKPFERLAKVAAQCAVKMAQGDAICYNNEENLLKCRTQDGHEVPCRTLPPTMVMEENMEEVIIESGFHLRDEVYLNIDKEN